jgi:hypothetical protein
VSVAARVAKAADQFERHRARLAALSARAARLARIDVIVVDGERAALGELETLLGRARQLLAALAEDAGDAVALQRLEAHLAPDPWSALDEVDRLLTAKDDLARQARELLQQRLDGWTPISHEVEVLLGELRDRYPHVIQPRQLARSRSRLRALLRQANSGFTNSQLLDAWRALDSLDSLDSLDELHPSRHPGGFREVPKQLRALIRQAEASAGRVQLTALSGPVDGATIEYTLILLTLTGDRQVGINLHDTSTLVRRDRNTFVRGAANSGATTGAAPTSAAATSDAAGAARDGRPPALTASTDQDATHRLQEIGHDLFRLMIPDRLKAEIRRHAETPLMIITNDGVLPWEMLYDTEFIALSRPVARMLVGRAAQLRSPTLEPRTRDPRVALVASTGPGGMLGAAIREVDQIQAGLRATWGDTVVVDLFVSGAERPACGEQFDRLLKSGDYDIIHYAGHARFDSLRPRQSALLLDDDEPCTADKIEQLLDGSPLVFLNACETARMSQQGGRPGGTGEGDPTEGLVGAFLYGGALACIGSMWPVADTVAARFAIRFYAAAFEGQSLGDAMRTARIETRRRYPHDPSWASFVLYGDPSRSLATLPRPDNTAD